MTSDEDSPLGSPRLRLGSGKKAAKTAAKQPLKGGPQQIQGLVDSLSKTAGNALGATWLDKIRQNLAEERARAVAQAAAGGFQNSNLSFTIVLIVQDFHSYNFISLGYIV